MMAFLWNTKEGLNVQQKAANLKLFVGSKVILWNKLMKEVLAKRVAGPFESVPFPNSIQSLIGLVAKGENKSDTRLIFHLSYPKRGESVNSGIPKECCTVAYPDFMEVVKLCWKAGKNCKIGKSDMTSAFRQLGIAP